MDTFITAAEHLWAHKQGILVQWRELVRADSRLPERRLSFTDRELQDHLPNLLDSLVQALKRGNYAVDDVRLEGAQHGTTRRAQGYSITHVIVEFSIFRKLLRQMLEQLATATSPDSLFEIQNTIIDLADHSELGSVEQYMKEMQQERDAA